MLGIESKAKSVVISAGFKVPLNWFVLQKFTPDNKPCGCAELAPKSEITALAQATVQMLNYKFNNPERSEQKIDVYCIHNGYLDGEFFVTISCNPSKGTVHRATKKLIDALTDCHKYYSIWSSNMRLLGVTKVNRVEYNYVCNEFRTAMAKMKIVMVGKLGKALAKVEREKDGKKIKVDNKALLEAYLAERVKFTPHKETKVPANHSSKLGTTAYPKYDVSGRDAAYLYMMLMKQSEPVTLANNHVSVNREGYKCRNERLISSFVSGIKRQFANNNDFSFYVLKNAYVGPSNAKVSFVDIEKSLKVSLKTFNPNT